MFGGQVGDGVLMTKGKPAGYYNSLAASYDEAAKFWPVYDRYQKEINVVGDRLVGVIQDYSANFSNLSDDKATKLVDDYLTVEADRVKGSAPMSKSSARLCPDARWPASTKSRTRWTP